MESKKQYNFLRSGCLFCYRDNFSGLSNETIGAASFNSCAMDSSVHQFIATVNTYQQLLFRYATTIVKNKLVASFIIEEVINEYSKKVQLISPSEIRLFLHTSTQQKCEQWLAAKGVTLNMRKPKNPT